MGPTEGAQNGVISEGKRKGGWCMLWVLDLTGVDFCTIPSHIISLTTLHTCNKGGGQGKKKFKVPRNNRGEIQSGCHTDLTMTPC
jgi:hypothetical protein